jgi:hypothetical protein
MPTKKRFLVEYLILEIELEEVTLFLIRFFNIVSYYFEGSQG